MLLVILVVIIASVILYMGFNSVKSNTEKTLMVAAYVLLLSLVFKYLMSTEGFKVSMKDEDFINEVEQLDIEAAEKFDNSTTTTNARTTTTKAEETDNNVGENTYNPTLIVNIPPDEQSDSVVQVVNQGPQKDPFKPSDELFKSTCNNREYFNQTEKIEKFNINGNHSNNQSNSQGVENFGNKDPAYVPYVDNSVSGYRLYTSRDFVPGMAFIPPTEWEVPQPHKTSGDCNLVCAQVMPDTRKLPIAMMDYGTPINALELGPDGLIAKSEEDAPLTSVGSLMPKFEYREYVDCPKHHQSNSPGVSASSTTKA